MEKFDYIIVTSENTWEGTFEQVTPQEAVEEIKIIAQRLKDDGRGDEKIIVYSADKMESYSV
jgi:hypothetical protein